MGGGMVMREKKLIVISLIILTVIGTTPSLAFMRLGPEGLEVDGEMLGTPIEEKNMEDMRGGYLGVNFSVLFEGFWDTLGNFSASLITNGGTGSGSTGTGSSGTTIPPSSLPPNTAVKIEASIGDLGGGKGIFQITQVPGSGNIVNNTLLVNIQIIQVLGNTLPSTMNFFK
jgi:hypothetical protein